MDPTYLQIHSFLGMLWDGSTNEHLARVARFLALSFGSHTRNLSHDIPPYLGGLYHTHIMMKEDTISPISGGVESAPTSPVGLLQVAWSVALSSWRPIRLQ
jgi:hypothetical protein